MALSMTGFGAAEGDIGGRRARVEIRTVNHRWFNLSIRLPAELAALEGEVRDALRRDFERGHVTVSVRWTEDRTFAPADLIDWTRVAGTVEAMRAVQDRFGLSGDVSVDLVMRHADVMRSPADDAVPSSSAAELAPIVAGAAEACRTARRREGDVLTADLAGRVDALQREAAHVTELMPARLVRERDRMRANVAQLLDGRLIDDARMAQELAMLADRLDITEELVRFHAHLAATREALAKDGPVGKQLGFIAQELGREVNTMGSKANDAHIAQHVVAMKGELEKFREQLENLE